MVGANVLALPSSLALSGNPQTKILLSALDLEALLQSHSWQEGLLESFFVVVYSCLAKKGHTAGGNLKTCLLHIVGHI